MSNTNVSFSIAQGIERTNSFIADRREEKTERAEANASSIVKKTSKIKRCTQYKIFNDNTLETRDRRILTSLVCRHRTMMSREMCGEVRVCRRWKNKTNGFKHYVDDVYPTYRKGASLYRDTITSPFSPSTCSWKNPHMTSGYIHTKETKSTRRTINMQQAALEYLQQKEHTQVCKRRE